MVFLKLKDLVTLSSILTIPVEGEGCTIYCDAFGVDLWHDRCNRDNLLLMDQGS